MENNNNMNEQRNQLAGEQTENLKNPFWAYALIGFSVVVIIIILGGKILALMKQKKKIKLAMKIRKSVTLFQLLSKIKNLSKIPQQSHQNL